MSEIAIRVENIGKAYTIGLEDKKSETLFGAIKKSIAAPIRNFRNLKNLSDFSDTTRKDLFYALKDISFDVMKGEAVAIIGHNGAGKSTLLKIISRITDPTAGKIEIFGRVSSLLEVGTGFHPDLTGRENVYLNGAILGMRKNEIDRKFDEIVDFAGVEKFIDTPVKRYSSGMRVRLAFSVAAHLEAEMLLIDEVLAVGDTAFQKKCLGKMNEVTSQGRTVLFVSHNMGAVKELCTRGIVLANGRVTFDGNINDSIVYYLEAFKNKVHSLDEKKAEAKSILVGDLFVNDGFDTVIEPGDRLKISLPVNSNMVENPQIVFIAENYMGDDVINLSLTSKKIGYDMLNGHQVIEIKFPPLWLAPGIYSGYFKILTNTQNKIESNRSFFEVKGSKEIEQSGFHSGKKNTLLAPVVEWKISEVVV
jgi:lipopolysaccharide transport system ATP-binding protein